MIKSRHRVIALILCCSMVFIVVGHQKARAEPTVLTGLAYALGMLLFSTGASMAIDDAHSGDWREAWDNIDINMEDVWASMVRYAQSSMTAASNGLLLPIGANAVLMNTQWQTVVDPDRGKGELTLEQTQALKAALDYVAPGGVEVKKDLASAELGVNLLAPTVTLESTTAEVISTGSTAATADVHRLRYDGIVLKATNTNVTYENLSMFISNYNNMSITGSFNFTYKGMLPVVFCVTGSECYNYLNTNRPYASQLTSGADISHKQGFVLNLGNISDQITKTSLVTGQHPSNTVLTANMYNGTDDFGVPAICRLLPSGTIGKKTYWMFLSSAVAATVVDTVKIDEAQYSAMIAAWSQAIAQGEADTADKITFALATQTAALGAQLQGTVTQNIEATNAQTEAIVNAIAAATAAAAASVAVGELDLTKMTLGQIVQSRFPFCIPFDLYNAFTTFQGAGTEPHFWYINLPIGGRTHNFVIDLTMFEPFAAIVRWGVLVSFSMGLILITRKIIKG